MPFVKGDKNINRTGLNRTTAKEKLVKKAQKQFIKEYVEELAQALPELSPVLLRKAKQGDLPAIKEVNDRVMGKAKQVQEHIGDEDKPLTIKFVNFKRDGDNNTI